MAHLTTAVKRGKTPDWTVYRDEWISFCSEFTRQNRGAHAVVEVLGGDIGDQVETEDRPFDGISADVKDGEHTVWISFGDTPETHLTHGIHGVTEIRVRPATGLLGAAVLIVTRDSSKTLLELGGAQDFELSPGPARDGRS